MAFICDDDSGECFFLEMNPRLRLAPTGKPLKHMPRQAANAADAP